MQLHIENQTGNSLTVLNTKSNIRTVITQADLSLLKMYGVPVKERVGEPKDKAQKYLDALDKLIVGSPVQIRLLKYLGYSQCIFVGKLDENTYQFFDNSGADGVFNLSAKFIRNHIDDIGFITEGVIKDEFEDLYFAFQRYKEEH